MSLLSYSKEKQFEKFSTKTKRILYLINISTTKNLMGDSGVRLAYEFMKNCYERDIEYFFYVLAPKEVAHIFESFDNVKIIPYTGPDYRWLFAMHFNVFEMIKLLFSNYNYRYDVIWCNQPELVAQLHSLTFFHSNYSPEAFSYNHWLGIEESMVGRFKTRNEPLLLQILGALHRPMFVDSNWARNIFLERAHNFVQSKILDDNVKILNPPVDIKEKDMHRDNEKFDTFTVMFNHRLHSYTGFTDLSKIVDELKDVNFIVTNPVDRITAGAELSGKQNVRFGPFDRAMYSKMLWKSHCGLALHTEQSVWSLSTLEAMSCELPVIVPKRFAFPEIVGDDYPLFFERVNEVPELILKLKNNPEFAREIGKRNRKRVENMFDWNALLPKWCEPIEQAYQNILPSQGSSGVKNVTEAVKRIYNYIKEKGIVSQQEIFEKCFDATGWMVKINDYVFILKNHEDIQEHVLENYNDEIARFTMPKSCSLCNIKCVDKVYYHYSSGKWLCEMCADGIS